MASTHVSETSLLQKVDPAQHSDDWPILELSSCDIYAQGNGSGDTPLSPDYSKGLSSLLEAGVHNPLIVRGKLQSIPRELSHLRLRRSTGTEPLQVENVRKFSYGQYEDGRLELWAAGAAAWYTIRPSRAYKATYDTMIEAVRVLYFCTDIYDTQTSKSRKSKNADNITADSVLARYAGANGITQDQAESVFEKHARFLLGSMLSGKENVEWSKTNLWTWMIETFSDIHRQLIEDQKLGVRKRKRSSGGSERRSVRSRASQGRAQAPRDSSVTEESEVDSIGPDKKPPLARKGKSVLRPRTSKYVSIERASNQSSRRPSIKTQDSQQDTSSKPSISRRSTRKETLLELNDEADSVLTMDDGAELSSDQSSESDASSDVHISLGQGASIRLDEEHLAPTDEGDVWSCPLDGCMHRVYAASEYGSRSLIKDHYRQHGEEDDAETRLELVRKMQAPGLSVNRLMNRIQAFTGKGPQPILQRY